MEDQRPFEAIWQASGLARLEGAVDAGQTITRHTYAAAPTGSLETVLDEGEAPALSSLELPRISIDIARDLAEDETHGWAAPWFVANLGRGEGEVRPADLTIANLLGEGGMGQVALASQRSLDREVAVKCLKPDERRESAIAGLLHEGRILGALAHPNVVPVHALGIDDTSRPILVIKRIEGVSWRDLIRDPEHEMWARTEHLGLDPLVRHLQILIDVTNAVAFAHSRGIIHRDLKPENVMIGSYGEVYVLDWGIATRLSELPPPGTGGEATECRIVGTPAYLAPEMLGEGRTMDERTDIYLLGAILHEILTGAPPHSGSTLFEIILSAHASERREFGPAVPGPLADICNRAMDADPGRRFPDALSLRQAIVTFLEHRGSLALTAAADRRREEFEAQAAGGSYVEASRLFAECRFGYLQALDGWPGNEAAAAGLEGSLARMVGVELDEGHLAAAEALLARMTAPPPGLVERLDEARAALESQRLETEALQRMRREMDFESGHGPRVRFFAALGIAGGLFLFGHVLPNSRPGQPHGYPFALSVDAIVLSGFVGLLAWQRRSLLATRIHRMFFGFFCLTFVFKFLQRVLCFRLGVDLTTSMTIDMMGLAVLSFLGGLTIRPWIHWGGVVSAAVCLALVAWPAQAQPIYGAGNGLVYLAAVAFVVHQFLRQTRSTARIQP